MEEHSKIEFRYQDDLLSEVLENRQTVEHFAWRLNQRDPGTNAGYMLPKHLSKDGTGEYDYQIIGGRIYLAYYQPGKMISRLMVDTTLRLLDSEIDGIHRRMSFAPK
jgi:hypothetical protein